jgi:two-component system nitrate/nitrite response regulator NarL
MVTIRVFIAAHVRLYREGLAEILAREEGMDVVGTAGERGEIRAQVRALQPDVVLLDPALPESMEAVRELADASHRKVVALASLETEPAVIACAEAGVSGYVTRNDSLADLVATIRSVARGDLLCSPRMAGTLLRRVTALAAERSHASAEGRLTSRELQILRLIDEGFANKQIAIRLGIELPTVKNHVHNILEKLGVARRGEAVARLRHGPLLEATHRLASPKD